MAAEYRFHADGFSGTVGIRKLLIPLPAVMVSVPAKELVDLLKCVRHVSPEVKNELVKPCPGLSPRVSPGELEARAFNLMDHEHHPRDT